MSLVLGALTRHAQRRAHAPALICGAQCFSYAALKRAVDDTAHLLSIVLRPARGCVALALENSAAFVILDLALLKIGRASLALPSFFTPAQSGHALTKSNAAWLITAGGVGACISIGGEQLRIRPLGRSGDAAPEGTAKITFTSGTTGAPKGVCLSRAHMEAVAYSIVDAIGAEFAGVHAAILPLAVLLENVAGLYTVLLAGGCYCADPPAALGLANPFKPDFAAMGHTLVERGATSAIIVPELLRGMLIARAFGVMPWPAFRLVAVGGAKVAPALLNAARAAGMPIYEGYGLSECASVVAVNTPAAHLIGSVGRPLAHLQVEIADDGEIVVNGPPFLGYAGESPRQDAVRTGDIGRMDEDGFLFVMGRKSSVIITSYGRNVSPEWIESELLAQPEIRNAMVFGEARPTLGALIAPSTPGVSRAQIGEAVARANARLPAYARVESFHLVEPFSVERGEITANARLRRDVLGARYLTMIQAGDAPA